MARYKKAYEGERRTATLTAQLTPSERSELRERAAAAGLSPSEYVRQVVFRKPGPSAEYAPRPGRPIRELAELVFQFRAIGNNLNQLARQTNTLGAVEDPAELVELLKVIDRRIASAQDVLLKLSV